MTQPRPSSRGPSVNLSSVREQEQVSGSTTSTVLQKLDPDTEYSVTVVPVYPEMEGISQTEKGKTSEFIPRLYTCPFVTSDETRPPAQIRWVK